MDLACGMYAIDPSVWEREWERKSGSFISLFELYKSVVLLKLGHSSGLISVYDS